MTGQEQRIKISELPTSVSFSGLWTLGYQIVDGKKTSVKVSLDEIGKAYEDAVAAASAAGKPPPMPFLLPPVLTRQPVKLKG